MQKKPQPSENSSIKRDKSLLLQSLSNKFGDVSKIAGQQTRNIIEVSTQLSGKIVNRLGENWLIRKLAGVLNLNWLVGASTNINLDKAAADVQKLFDAYPNESPQQIAHRIMVDKATKAGGIGLATSIIPGFAAALLAIDLAATTELQSEMLYQIAAVYGLDLKDPARKGEVLAIFGLALGGGRLLKAVGLGLLRNVPFAGAAIGASSNATMIYSLGYAACRFYEAKLDDSTSLNSEQTLTTLKQQSEEYLENAITQKAIMDKILVYMILNSHPNKSWEEISPELKALEINKLSLDDIKNTFNYPEALNQLINQLDHDYAVPLLAQCQRIAHLNGTVTPVEQSIIDAIASKVHPNN